MKSNGISHRLLAAFIFTLGSLSATEPDWYASASKTDFFLREESALPVGRYEGKGICVKIGPGLLEPKRLHMELNIPAGTVLEDVTLEAFSGAVLNLRRCTLRRVAFKIAAKGIVNLEGCALENCYISSERAPYRRASGEFYTQEEVFAEIGRPQLTMADCVVAGSTLHSPYLCGLTATRCTFVSCALESGAEDGKQPASRYVKCAFISSKMSSTDVLLTTSECRFKECECPDLLMSDAGGRVTSPVELPLAWEGGRPALPPKTTNGKVTFVPVAAAPETGSPLSYQWNGGRLKSADLPFSGEGVGQPKSLDQAWTLITTESYRALLEKSVTPAAPPAGPPVAALITGAPAAEGVTFKSRLNQVNGLLISQLEFGGKVGKVSRMSLSALPSLGQAPSTLKFNQDVGASMGKALNEVSKFSQLRHGGWPVGHVMEIGFEDKYIGKDGPSAAVACALLLEAAITGKKWDPAFAVTGDMNADGSVQPIGGVQAKIRGATKGSCKIVGLPVKNEKAVMDLLLLEGPAPLIGITVFGIQTFEDALLLADSERAATLQNALTDFDAMRTVMLRDPRQMMQLLRTPHAVQRLQALLAAAPNCYSAKYLLLYLQNRVPRVLSIGGSIEAAQSSADAIVDSIDHDVESNMSRLKGDELGSSLNKLRALRPLLDPRVWPYVDNLADYGEIIRGALLNPVRSAARSSDLVGKARKAAAGARAAYAKLINDAQVREELGL